MNGAAGPAPMRLTPLFQAKMQRLSQCTDIKNGQPGFRCHIDHICVNRATTKTA